MFITKILFGPRSVEPVDKSNFTARDLQAGHSALADSTPGIEHARNHQVGIVEAARCCDFPFPPSESVELITIIGYDLLDLTTLLPGRLRILPAQLFHPKLD